MDFIYIQYFKSLTTIGQSPVNMDILAPKIGDLHSDPRTQNFSFLKNGSNSFDYISTIYGDHVPK
jgi:hypothetical protein